MDSITQIVLGAAVGEALLGKKIGNKAILWGAIAGTVPDLDVYQSFFYDSLTANELHRGFSHSILFCIIFSPLLAWLARTKEKWSLVGLVTLILGYPLITLENTAIRVVIFVLWAIVLFFVQKNTLNTPAASQRDWTKLMFGSLITHPLLDCHTTWGTQLFWPLPYKLAWNSIFVVDPLYTLPFLFFVLVAMSYKRTSKKRAKINLAGIVLSCLYLLWSLGAKYYTYCIFEKNLQDQEINYSRLTTAPTPFNTFLWSATAETDSTYVTGLYSIFDGEKSVQFVQIEHHHHLANQLKNEDILKRMMIMSKNWRIIKIKSKDTMTYIDARFGPMYLNDMPEYVFGYTLVQNNEILQIDKYRPSLNTASGKRMISTLWRRIWSAE